MKRFLLLLLVLTACATPEQIAQVRQLQMQEDFNQCAAYGLKPGTERFGECRMNLDLARRPVYVYDTTPRFHGGFRYSHWH